jgi:hypothetical protein
MKKIFCSFFRRAVNLMKDEKYNFTSLRFKKNGKFSENSLNFGKEGRKKPNFRQK